MCSTTSFGNKKGISMRFYTIQKRCTWNKWKKQGYLEAYDTNFDDFFEPSYKWMMKQMEKRLPNYKGEIPIWLWIKKPSFYKVWSRIPRKKFVLLTLELDEEEVLISNFDGWHVPLSGLTSDEDGPWERVFDLEWYRKNYYEEGYEETLQATTGRIAINRVIKVKFFSTKYEKY